MAPTLTKTKPKGTKKAAAKPREANAPAVSIKCTIDGETIINGEFPSNMAAKLQKAWNLLVAGSKTTSTTRTNKTMVRGGTTGTRSR